MTRELEGPVTTRSCAVKGSSVAVTLPALFRPETSNWHILDLPTLRAGLPLKANRGRCEEKRREGRKREREKEGTRWMDSGRWHFHQLLVLRQGFYMTQVSTVVDGGQPIAKPSVGNTNCGGDDACGPKRFPFVL